MPVPVLGNVSPLSPAYMWTPRLICFRLFKQVVRLARAFAPDKTGNNKATKMAMIAMTTSNSIRVNARRGFISDKNTGHGDSFQAIIFSREISFYPRQPFLPDAVKLHRGADVAQAVFGDVPEFALGHQRVHVHAGDAVAFGRFDAERLAVKIQVEPPRRAFASAHAVKRELFRQVAMRFDGVTIAQPVLFRDGHVEQRRAEINERHVKPAPVEGHDVVVMLRHVPKRREQFKFIRAGHELDRPGLVAGLLKILGEKQHLPALRVGIEHGDADDLGGERPEIELLPDFGALGFARRFIGDFFGLAEQVFLLRLVKLSPAAARRSRCQKQWWPRRELTAKTPRTPRKISRFVSKNLGELGALAVSPNP